MNPHDAIFKENFSKLENAIDLINNVLPKEIKDGIDFKTLVLENDSYTDKKLKKYFSDLVYTCDYKNNQIKIALLFEHKSYFVEYPHFQLLKYKIKIWEQNIKKKEPFKIVIPIIFYHGVKKWNYISFKEYFKEIDENLIKYIPIFEYLLIDLSKYSDDEVKDKMFNTIENKILMNIMKNIFNEKKITENLVKYLEVGRLYFENESGIKFIESVIYYLFNTMKEDNKVQILTKIDKSLNEGGDIMTIAMSLRKEGKIEGAIEGKQNTLIKQMSKKFGLSENEINLIKNCNYIDKLDQSLDDILFFDNKLAVLKNLE